MASVSAVATISSVSSAQTWKPFTHVDDVCTTCTTGPAYDRVELRNGQEVRARVVAENDAFLVLERFGELRALDRGQLQTVVRNAAADRPAGFGDQILLKDGIVLAGVISGELVPTAASFDITIPRTPDPLHHAAHETVAAVYRAGKLVWSATDGAPAAAPAAPAAPAAAPAK